MCLYLLKFPSLCQKASLNLEQELELGQPQKLQLGKYKNFCHFHYTEVSSSFTIAVLAFTGNSAENIWGNCCNLFHDSKCNKMLFCAGAGTKT